MSPAVYVQTNDATANEVIAFSRTQDGALAPLGRYSTFGLHGVDDETRRKIEGRVGSASNSSRSSQGRANVSAVLVGHQSGNCKLTSLHKVHRFFQQHVTVRRGCLVARKLNQVTSI